MNAPKPISNPENSEPLGLISPVRVTIATATTNTRIANAPVDIYMPASERSHSSMAVVKVWESKTVSPASFK